MINQKIKQLAEDMFSMGAHFALTKRYRHPSMLPFIHSTKNKKDLFDLEAVAKVCDTSLECVRKLGENKKKILFVTSRNESKEIVKKTAKSLNMPYVAGRWIGGTLTNFSSIQGRIKRLKQLRDEHEQNVWNDQTKKDRLLLLREMTKLNETFLGMLNMEGLPDALVIVDPKKETITINEAIKKNIPVIALANADSNISNVQYPIIANITSKKTMEYLMNCIVEAYKSNQK